MDREEEKAGVPYELPDGAIVRVKKPSRAPELLFQPSLLDQGKGGEEGGVGV